MAHFYGEMRGNRGPTSRCGHKTSGIWCHIRGWQSGVSSRGYYDEDLEKDVFEVYATKGSAGYGDSILVGRIIDGNFIPEKNER